MTIKKHVFAAVLMTLCVAALLCLVGCEGGKSVVRTWYQEAGYSATLEISESSYTLTTGGDVIDQGSVHVEGDACYLDPYNANWEFGLSSDGKRLTCSKQTTQAIGGIRYASQTDAASNPRSF